MHRLTMLVLLVVCVLAMTSLLVAQSKDGSDAHSKPSSTAASEEEVQQLRSEVEAQRQTIEELKARVQRMADANAQPTGVRPADAGSQATNGTRLMNTALVEPVESAFLKLARRTSNVSGSLFQRHAPWGVTVGESAQSARTIAPGCAPKLVSIQS